MNRQNRRGKQRLLPGFAVILALGLAGCDSAAYRGQIQVPTEPQEVTIITEESSSQENVLEGVGRITPQGPEYEILKDLPVPETEPAPEYYRIGVESKSVFMSWDILPQRTW